MIVCKSLFGDCKAMFLDGKFHCALQKFENSHKDIQSLQDTILFSNNTTVCKVMQILSLKRRLFPNQEQQFKDELKRTLNKARSVPPSPSIVCTELLVLYNLIFIKILKHEDEFSDVDDDYQISETLRRALKCLHKQQQCSQMNDISPLIDDCISNLARSRLSADEVVIRDNLIRLCCIRSIWLCKAEKTDEAISCLESCRKQRHDSSQESKDTLTLTFPLSLLLNGGIDFYTDVSPDEQINMLLGLMYYLSDNRLKCTEYLTLVRYKPWLMYTKYILAYIDFKDGRYVEALVKLGQKDEENADADYNLVHTDSDVELGHDADRINALCHYLFGSCLSKLNKPHCAIQKYKDALETDFTFLQPLYNISLEYRKLGLQDAELESLNLLTMALEKQPAVKISKGDNCIIDKVIQDTMQNVTFLPTLYLLANRCFQLKRFDVGSHRYMDLLKNLNQLNLLQTDNDSNVDMKLPPIQKIYLETICTLIYAEKYEECIVICDRFISCNLLPNSQCSSENQTSLNISSTQDEIFPSSGRKRQRSVESEDSLTAPDDNSWNEEIITLLYKSEALIYLEKLSDAVSCLECVTDILQSNPNQWVKKHEVKSGQVEPKPKRQRISSEGSSIDKHSEDINGGETDVIMLAAQVYGHMGTALARKNKSQDALHFLRISLQLNPDSLNMLYKFTHLMWTCDRQREAVSGWCTARSIETKSDTFQLANVLKQKQNSLRSVGETDTDCQLGDIGPDDSISEIRMLKLDILCLNYLMKWKQKSSYTW